VGKVCFRLFFFFGSPPVNCCCCKPLVCRQRLFIDLDRAGKSGKPAFIRVREVEAIKGDKMIPYADYIYDDYELFKEDPYEEI
jgi:hypothetical protein